MATKDDAPAWASFVLTVATVIGTFAFYEAFKPQTPLPPADGLRTDSSAVTVSTSEWQEPLEADRQTIRAAMLTCHPHELARILLHRPDGRVLQVYREKGGWEIRKGEMGERPSDIAIRNWGGPDPEPVRAKWYNVFSRSMRGTAFGNQDTEEILNGFLLSKPDPSFLTWKQILRD